MVTGRLAGRNQLGQHTPLTYDLWSVLPVEIIAWIFLLVVEIEPNPRAPLFLSQTCRRWRSIAIENQLLWRHIIINQMEAEYYLAQLCVSRCSSCAIDFTIQSSMHLTAGHVSRLLDIMTSCSKQLRHVTVHADHVAVHRFIHWFAQCDGTPNPETLSISTLRATENEEELEVPPHTVAGPDLHAPVNMALQSPSLLSSPPPFARLRHLKIGNQTYQSQPNFRGLISILSRCPDLQTLILQGPCDPRDMNPSPDPITFRSLTHLEISYQTSAAQSLALAEWDVEVFDRVIEHFGVHELYSTVTSLRICGINVSTLTFGAPAFLRFFKAMTNVEHLTIELHGMNPISVSCLSDPDPEVPVLLQSLTGLKVSGAHRNCVAHLVTKRKQWGLPIQDLVLQKKTNIETPHILQAIYSSVKNVSFIEWDGEESTCSGSEDGYDSDDDEG
ncbi:hypothetical protein BS47DRAFT_1359180 [Hydnum rufescens UP504]|uniref:F-box domain-containing protein n=1 Tax=Hydnum rufescens UP504 TaxID=1448309 RepID=A0A9P6B8E0_9AGAM|nr:hypothetical protein BS47DRAFT_1359180 [Hydnum rufescens UP504]